MNSNITYQLIHGDCLTELPKLAAQSVDAIITDIPYGTTACSWDTVIPFEPMWAGIKHVNKPSGAVVLFGSQPFTSALVMSNVGWFKHEWIWIKNRGSNFANTVREPMKEHESVIVFSQGGWTYNKQMQERTGGGSDRVKYNVKFETTSENYSEFETRLENKLPELRVPSSWQKFNTETGLHPTQKPVALMEYLIKTYTNPGDTILDFTCGSGSTGVAAVQNGRNFIGIDNGYCEKKGPYYGARWVDVARERIANAAGDFTITEPEKEKLVGQLSLFGEKQSG